MPTKKDAVKSYIVDKNVVTEDSDKAREFYAKSRFGEIKNSKVYLSFYEALYLVEKEKLDVLDSRNNVLSFEGFLKKIKAKKDFLVKYAVFKDLRSKGYIVKTALKFGADFRVYDKGIKPGQGHAKWVVFCVHESDKQTWHDFSAKNRVAHSTKKKLLISVVDDEMDISYWEVGWQKP